jgi:hypothetical protein
MGKFFHVDRTGKLVEGQTIELQIPKEQLLNSLPNLIRSQFPKRVSNQGANYLFNVYMGYSPNPNSNIEWLCEHIRQCYFPDHISRFQAFFAFKTEQQAIEFLNKYTDTHVKVWEIHSEDEGLDLDMSLLKYDSSPLVDLQRIHDYWEGKESSAPFIETLLRTPIQIGSEVDITHWKDFFFTPVS